MVKDPHTQGRSPTAPGSRDPPVPQWPMSTYATSRTNLDPAVLLWASSTVNGDSYCSLPSLLIPEP